MATKAMGQIDFTSLTSTERDLLLSQILNSDQDEMHLGSPMPSTAQGKAVLKGTKEGLLREFEDGEMGDIVLGALNAWECEFTDGMWFILDDHIDQFAENLESAIASAFIEAYDGFELDLETVGTGDERNKSQEEPSTTNRVRSESEHAANLSTLLSASLPEAVSKAIRFDIDTRGVQQVVQSVCRAFVLTSIVPELAKSICATEGSKMGSHETLMRPLTAECPKCDGCDENGGEPGHG